MSSLKYIDEQTPTFFINSSSLEGRFDPYYYNSALKDFTENQNYPVKNIYEVVKSFTSGFGVGRQDQGDAETGLIQIRPTNLDQFGLLKFDRNVYIPKSLIKHEGQLLEKGDVIFNNTNSQEWVGKAAYYDLDEKLAFSNHITVLKVDENKINARYLWLILNLYQQKKIFFSICTNWNNQSGVSLDLLKSLKIPVPDIQIQESIIDKLQIAFQKRAELNEVCNALLSGIDSYILNELGIIALNRDSSLEERMFQTTFKNLSGKRFDPKLFDTHSQNLFKAIEKSKFPKSTFKAINCSINSWGLGA
jgi:type I restriction enzyme, S subunit